MNKLFVIGLPRTGTTSISVALLNEGFKVAHTAYTKRAFELADVISDAPCFSDYAYLDLLFPGSKFVYLNRPLDLWLPSILRLLKKMQGPLASSSHFNPVLKRSFEHAFKLSTFNWQEQNDEVLFSHLEQCYKTHQQQVLSYFNQEHNFIKLDVSAVGSLSLLLSFIGQETEDGLNFPVLNVGKHVDDWKNTKHKKQSFNIYRKAC